MMSGHAPNPIIFNKKIKFGHPKHSLNTYPTTSLNISLLPYPAQPPINEDGICVSPLMRREENFYLVANFNLLSFSENQDIREVVIYQHAKYYSLAFPQ